MAPKVYAANLDSLKPSPQWGEREVRRLLRGLRRPHTLGMEPLVHFLCDAYGIGGPYDASLEFVRDTFVDKGLVGKRLYELVRTCDVEANETLLGAASEMGVSPRQFFRYRREAIVALVAHANNLRLAHPATTSPVEELARLLGETAPTAASRVYDLAPTEKASLHRVDTLLNAGTFFDDAVLEQFHGTERLRISIRIARACYIFGSTRAGDTIRDAIRARMVDAIVEDRELIEFELVHLHYVRAIHRESAARCMQLAHEARRAAKGDEARTIAAVLIESESAIHSGDLELAEQALIAADGMVLPSKQLRHVSMLVAARAAISFMRGDLPRALAYINSAQLALPDRPLDAMTINAFIGRVSLAMGVPWRAPRELLEITEPPIRMVTPSEATGVVALDGSTRRAFPRLYLKLVDLRAALAAGGLDSIDGITEALALTRQSGYRSLESLALAVLAQWFDRNGSHDEAQHHAVAAWEILVDLGDGFMAHDVFYRTRREYAGIRCRRSRRRLSRGAVSYAVDALCQRTARRRSRRPRARRVLARDAASLARRRRVVERARRRIRYPGRERATDGAWHKQRAAFVRSAAGDLAPLLPAAQRSPFTTNLKRRLEAFYERFPGCGSRMNRPQF